MVAGIALAYKPPDYLGAWKLLADAFATDKRPRKITFQDEHVFVGPNSLFNLKPSAAGFAQYDVEVDEEGLWLVYEGPEPQKSAPCMFIPGYRIKFERQKQTQYQFSIDASERVLGRGAGAVSQG